MCLRFLQLYIFGVLFWMETVGDIINKKNLLHEAVIAYTDVPAANIDSLCFLCI